MSEGHALAREQLAEILDAAPGVVELLGQPVERDGGFLVFEISLPFQGAERVSTGLPIKARERFLLWVSNRFPFVQPAVHVAHRRFAGFPHVQWGYCLCLYQASSDWKPEDGMYGLVTRLDGWVRAAALDNLDPEDAPLHPPVAYPSSNRLIVPIADAPLPGAEPWWGFAALRQRGRRTEITQWVALSDAQPESFAAAILLHERLPFEFPRTVDGLFKEFERHGVSFAPLVWLLAKLALRTAFGEPLLVVVGAPMRRVQSGGPLLQHLAVWEITADAADNLRSMNALLLSEERFQPMGKEAMAEVAKWAVEARVDWCSVRESRPAVTRRRDHDAATAWFLGKVVDIWGCGAIGSHIAESLTRAGVRGLILRDNGVVVPGIFVRQAFDDEHIGETKVEALRQRLCRINPDLEIQSVVHNILDHIDEPTALENVSIIIDCTGSSAVRLKLERRLRAGLERPPIASMGVSYNAQAALATLSLPSHSGGPSDIARRLKLVTCQDITLEDLRDAFWPASPRRERFQPEPGCSEPTFVGSDADLAALSARMLNAVGWRLTNADPEVSAAGWLFESDGALRSYHWTPDTVVSDRRGRYEIRIAPAALREMRAWTKRSQRLYGDKLETGGLIFGEVSEVAAVLWVTEAEGPPPDSDASEQHFTCGVAGMAAANEQKEERFRGSVSCLGSWHTHPTSSAEPSNVDLGAVAQLLGDSNPNRRTCLLLILAGTGNEMTLGAHAFRAALRTERTLLLDLRAAAATRIKHAESRPRDIGLALSGGGSRAIAFHLGCLRALNDLDLLTRLQVLSSVSGGSILAGMYAYTSDSFQEFDSRVVQLLRSGLVGDIARAWCSPTSLMGNAASLATNVPVSLLRTVSHFLPRSIVTSSGLLDPSSPPPQRYFSRSEAFRTALAERLFGERRVEDVQREGLQVVINATELRTGSAFRFGSRESGCWRFGLIPPRDAILADAIAASAAYPAFLPALDREYVFRKRDQSGERQRVLLTDGGVFENLAVSPMEPNRSESVSSNVFRPKFIIACDAGAGLLDDDSFPMWWPTRMHRSFLTTFRKAQDATRKRLHQIASTGEIAGFVLSYLGQNDRALPWQPADLPTRDQVYGYPTNFSAMADADIHLLTARGEQLTRLLLAHYLPDL